MGTMPWLLLLLLLLLLLAAAAAAASASAAAAAAAADTAVALPRVAANSRTETDDDNNCSGGWLQQVKALDAKVQTLSDISRDLVAVVMSVCQHVSTAAALLQEEEAQTSK